MEQSRNEEMRRRACERLAWVQLYTGTYSSTAVERGRTIRIHLRLKLTTSYVPPVVSKGITYIYI